MASKRLVSPTGKPKTLAATYPNAGTEAAYRRKLDALIVEMHRSLVYWIKAAWRAKSPHMAQDEDVGGSPAMNLRDVMRRLGARWQSRFDEAAEEMGRHFAKAAAERADGALAASLKKAGFTVRFRMTRSVNDVLQASIGEQIGLIKSIAAEHLQDVQGAVMRSVQTGRDLGSLTKELEQRYGVTRRRAAFIARDQNNKATATITRARQKELGITQALWVHSAGGRHPRPSHVKAGRDRLVYDVDKGALIDGDFILPGQLPNCRCVSRSIVPGFL